LAAQDSKPAQDLFTFPTPDNLICPASEIFDRAGIAKSLLSAVDHDMEGRDGRAAVVAILKAANAKGRAAIATAFRAQPLNAGPMTRAYSFLTDCLVEAVFTVATQHFHPNPTPTEGEKLSLFAVGGYGRGEMAPGSDVDLLFLTPYKITAWAESVIEQMLYIFWDLKMKIGHASRTIKDCIRLGREDYTVRTALLELRPLIGEVAMSAELKNRLRRELFHNTTSEFIEAKLAERAERHLKQGGQRYVLEPNVKEGKGCLRDLQSLFWIAKYAHGVDSINDLQTRGLFRDSELKDFAEAENFLWAVRGHLHLIAGRAQDQLTFDLQVECAHALGYKDSAGRRAVEYFMQDFFLQATKVGELTRIFLTALEATHVKQAPSLAGILRRLKRLKPEYVVAQNRLNFKNEKLALKNRLNLLRIFEEALRTGLLIHPDAMRLIVANLHLIDAEMHANPEAQRIFLDLILKHGNPERALRRMNELGVLGAFVPEFKRIVAMMQFDLYHHYTVDEHTIQCMSILNQIERGDLIEELPVATGILKKGVNRRVLYVALLLHDIGKGSGEDHSIVGARITRIVAPRLGLSAKDCKTVEWLVRYHLLMSDMAQKRDLADPRTVRDFAKAVTTVERLDLMTVLTVCDIRGVGPGVWNNWKAMLIRELYAVTADALENGLEAVNRSSREGVAKKALREALDGWDKKELRDETARHYGPYWQGLQTSEHVVFASLLKDLAGGEIRVDLHLDTDRDATRACFAAFDHPGIFSRMAGALALAGANVVDARTFTTKDGLVTAVFWIQDHEGQPYDKTRYGRMTQMIDKTMKGQVVARDALVDRDKIKKREKDFIVPTTITFDNDGSDIYTIIEVDTRDRPGLLHDLTRTMANSHIYIASAVIATYGVQVVDTFYVKDMFGLKFHNKSKQKTLEQRLIKAIKQGAQRAEA